VPSSLNSGNGPRLSVLKRQATSSVLKFDALIWSSGEYLVPLRSAALDHHSPFRVDGWPWDANCFGGGVTTQICPETLGITHMSPPTMNTSAGTDRNDGRPIAVTPSVKGSARQLYRCRMCCR